MSSDSATTDGLITVGLPVYNGARFLEAAIDSIRQQVGVELELIISDNASTDETEAICRRLCSEDGRLRYIRQPENRGAAWNYNELVRLARGSYFKWAAHDDVCAPTFLARCKQILDGDDRVVLAYPRAVDIDADGTETKPYPSLSYATQADAVARAKDVVDTPTPCFESFGLIRTRTLRETKMIGPYTSSDRTLFFELALRGAFMEVDEALFFHRQHDGRSVNSHRNATQRDAWFDPCRSGMHTSPRFRFIGEHVLAVVRSPLSATQKASVLVYLPRLVARYARPLAGETARWVRHRMRLSARPLHNRSRSTPSSTPLYDRPSAAGDGLRPSRLDKRPPTAT